MLMHGAPIPAAHDSVECLLMTGHDTLPTDINPQGSRYIPLRSHSILASRSGTDHQHQRYRAPTKNAGDTKVTADPLGSLDEPLSRASQAKTVSRLLELRES